MYASAPISANRSLKLWNPWRRSVFRKVSPYASSSPIMMRRRPQRPWFGANCRRLGLTHRYVHAPARNISVARNAALNAATAPLVAFIDDDETATQTWLAALLACHQSTGASIVFGPVQAIYEGGPAWLSAADMHSIRPAFRKGGVIDTGYTCNVLLARERMTPEMQAIRFDPALGRSGGEDTFFFHALYSRGATCAFTEAALVRERVHSRRARLGWLMKRSFRSGQTHARVLLTSPGWRPGLIMLAFVKFSYCLLGTALRCPWPARWRQFAVRSALHAGVVCRLAGLDDLQIY